MKPDFKWPQVAGFRLARHYLFDRPQRKKSSRAELVSVCRDVCGIQAQLMTAAQTALWARLHNLNRTDLMTALYQDRTLVKTSCMRQTLHLIPAVEFFVYISALRKSRLQALWRIMSRFGVTPKEAESMSAAVVAALRAGPLTQPELLEQIMPKAGRKMRKYLALVWSIQVFRPALVEGLICYGPLRNKKETFVLVDQWLPPRRRIPELEAQQILLRRYLSAFGPATLRDFSRWSGMTMPEVKAVHDLLKDELSEVYVGDNNLLILRTDRDRLQDSHLADQTLRLLPGFDPFMLGHVEKSHLVDSAHYKLVYRNQGWISPVILLNGSVIGVWSNQRRGQHLSLRIEPFERLSKRIQSKIEAEAASLASFWEVSWDMQIAGSDTHSKR
ncbi:MAG: winged helix DNA-binding domain-containing protein [bacterium]